MLGKIAVYLSFTLLGFSICYGIHNAGLFKADLFNDRAVNAVEHKLEHAVEKTEGSLELVWCTKLPRRDIAIDSWRCRSENDLQVIIDYNRFNGRNCRVTKILLNEWDVTENYTPSGWKIDKTVITHDRKSGMMTKDSETGLDPSTCVSFKQQVRRALVRQD